MRLSSLALTANDLKFNYYALTLAAMTGCVPEQAFRYLDGLEAFNNPEAEHQVYRHDITQEDIADMIRMRTFMTYKEVGQIFNMSAGSIYQRVKKSKQKEALN